MASEEKTDSDATEVTEASEGAVEVASGTVAGRQLPIGSG